MAPLAHSEVDHLIKVGKFSTKRWPIVRDVDPEPVVGPADVYSVDRERGPPVFVEIEMRIQQIDVRNRDNDAWDRDSDPVQEPIAIPLRIPSSFRPSSGCKVISRW